LYDRGCEGGGTGWAMKENAIRRIGDSEKRIGFATLISTFFFLAAYGVAPYLARQGLFVTDSGRKLQATAEVTAREPTASILDLYVRTSLAITYRSPVRSGSSAEVQVTISQKQLPTPNPGYSSIQSDSPPPPKEITTLRWPIELSLKASDAPEVKKLSPGASLPAILIWAPTFKSDTDETTLVLSANNLSGAERPNDSGGNLRASLNANPKLSLNINGKTSEVGISNDIALPISIYKNGIPVWLWEDVTLGASLLGFILTSAILTGFASRMWSKITGKRSASDNS
jgi:hypothetical protein